MSELGALSRRRFVRLAILTSGALVIPSQFAHAEEELCPQGGQACTYCYSYNVRAGGGQPSQRQYPIINPWRDWRQLRFVSPD